MDRAHTRGGAAKGRQGSRDYGAYGREMSVVYCTCNAGCEWTRHDGDGDAALGSLVTCSSACLPPGIAAQRWLPQALASPRHAPQKTEDVGNKQSASGRLVFRLGSVRSTAPHQPLSGEPRYFLFPPSVARGARPNTFCVHCGRRRRKRANMGRAHMALPPRVARPYVPLLAPAPAHLARLRKLRRHDGLLLRTRLKPQQSLSGSEYTHNAGGCL